MNFFETIGYNSISKYYKPEKKYGTINDNCVEYKGNTDENITMEPYLENIEPYLSGMLEDHRKSG